MKDCSNKKDKENRRMDLNENRRADLITAYTIKIMEVFERPDAVYDDGVIKESLTAALLMMIILEDMPKDLFLKIMDNAYDNYEVVVKSIGDTLEAGPLDGFV